ncbi:hypothetical protein HK102_012420, partial [Quaeritorhiza haematococci]
MAGSLIQTPHPSPPRTSTGTTTTTSTHLSTHQRTFFNQWHSIASHHHALLTQAQELYTANLLLRTVREWKRRWDAVKRIERTAKEMRERSRLRVVVKTWSLWLAALQREKRVQAVDTTYRVRVLSTMFERWRGALERERELMRQGDAFWRFHARVRVVRVWRDAAYRKMEEERREKEWRAETFHKRRSTWKVLYALKTAVSMRKLAVTGAAIEFLRNRVHSYFHTWRTQLHRKLQIQHLHHLAQSHHAARSKEVLFRRWRLLASKEAGFKGLE